MQTETNPLIVMGALAGLAGYRLKDKRQRVIRDVAAGRPVHPESACKADRAEYLRDEAIAARIATERLAAASRAAVAQWDELFSHDHAEPQWVADLRAAVAPFGGEL